MEETTLMLDSTAIKVHNTLVGLKRGYHEETGRSRGGLTTKVHAVTDGLGNPLRFLLSSGNCNNIRVAQTLLEPFDLNGKGTKIAFIKDPDGYEIELIEKVVW